MPRRLMALTLAVSLGCAACGGAPASRQDAPTPPPSSTARAAQAPATGADGAGDAYYPFDGNGGIDVQDYHVSIVYDPPAKKLDGDTVVTIKATADLSTFNLDLNGFTVSSVEVDDKPAQFARKADHELVITPAAPLASGTTFRTRVRYSGEPAHHEEGNLGTNGWQYTATGGAFAAGEPHSAASWYPANDTPRDKATFTVVAKVPSGWSVISNGREQPSTTDGGWTTFTWVESTRIITYLTTVAIEKWTFERSTLPNGTPVVSAYAPGAEDKKTLEARLPEILDFLSQKFGPYPQDAAGGIYLNENIGFSLEIQTRPMYARWVNLETVIHENAHQWFGDSVSVQSWADICLNECFASYAPWLWSEAKDHKDLDQEYRTQVKEGGDQLFGRPLFDMGAGHEFSAVYTKGPVALHALRRQIGDAAFDQVLKGWTAKHKDGNASWSEFEQFVTDIAKQDLSGFFKAWFHSDTKPADQYLYPGSLHK